MVNAATLSAQQLNGQSLTDREFEWIKDYLYRQSGIVLNDSKRAMVMGRLNKRLRYYELNSYMEYFQMLSKPGYETEALMAVDLLTTNETYFFREPKHFDFLVAKVITQKQASSPIRIWSAASSSGEEAYTIAMLLEEHAKSKTWEIIGTDISQNILAKARRGLYPLSATDKIPANLLKKYCLRGVDEYNDFFLIDPKIRAKIKFMHANLVSHLPDVGKFDVIFLRNVMIYFDMETKEKLVNKLQEFLIPGGYFIISHSESLNGMKTPLKMLSPSIYQKPGGDV